MSDFEAIKSATQTPVLLLYSLHILMLLRSFIVYYVVFLIKVID